MEFPRKDEVGEREFHRRLTRLTAIIGSFLLMILIKIGYMQFIQGKHFQERASKNSIQLIHEPAPRGLILDCKGRVLATNRPSFNVGIIQGILDNEVLEDISWKIKNILPIEDGVVKKRLREGEIHPFRPTIVARDIDIDKVVMIEERMLNLPGVVIQAQPVRFYPLGELASHILGYTGQISQRELVQMAKEGYRRGNIIGKSGVEKAYDRYLIGKEGGKQVEVDVSGRVLRVINSIDPVIGKTVVLTIDKEIQSLAYEALGKWNGAVVVMDVNGGGILALVSKPGFDPNLFSSYPTTELVGLLKDFASPLLNRGIQGTYQPGSLFKIIVTLAALEDGVIDPSTTFFCPGYYLVGRKGFRCWEKGGHGRVDLVRAITHSCNVYFYQLGMKVGVERMAHFAKLFGLGERTGIELVGEEKGLIPTPAWKENLHQERWYPGDTVNLSIGQGYIKVTPIQIANLMATLANGGRVYRPHLLKEIREGDGRPIMIYRPKIEREFRISNQTMEVLKMDLEMVVSKGTGRGAWLDGVKVAGKTGTAQNPHGEDHAWFACFAPLDCPRVAVVVLVEHGGMGGAVAAPIAGKILKGIFKG